MIMHGLKRNVRVVLGNVARTEALELRDEHPRLIP